MTPEEAAGLLTFEVKTTVTEDGQEVEKWVGEDGKLTTEETKLTLAEHFDFDEETGKYTLKLEELEAGEYTVIETETEPGMEKPNLTLMLGPLLTLEKII